MKRVVTLLIMLTWVLSLSIAEAVPTKLVVRAISKDAKFIGTSMGGAHVVIKDSETGKILAEGLTVGGTGDTEKIMIEPKSRFGAITDSATAGYKTVIDITEPKLVTIGVDAPYGMNPRLITSSTQIWLIPGKDIIGDGVIIEIPGFSVDVAAAKQVTLVTNKAVIPVQAKIVMI